MRADLELVARHTHSIRTYSVQGALGDIPALAEAFGLRVSLGIWLGRTWPATRPRSPRHPHRQRVAERGAGDSRQRGAVPPRGDGRTVDRLLDRVRAAVKVPVTTAEQWHVTANTRNWRNTST